MRIINVIRRQILKRQYGEEIYEITKSELERAIAEGVEEHESKALKSAEKSLERKDEEIKEQAREHAYKIQDLNQDHRLELEQKEFDLKHFKDDKIKELRKDVRNNQEQVAVLQKENEMLKQIVDLNGDVIDIKELLNALITKLPNVDLKSLTINTGEKK